MFSEPYNDRTKSYDGTSYSIDMTEVRSICIGDQDDDGCVIKRRESSSVKATVDIDFSLTDSKLSSIVFFPRKTNWKQSFVERKGLGFSAYTECGFVQAEIEIRMMGRDRQYDIQITDEPKDYIIPLPLFSRYENDWEHVDEVKFLFRKKHLANPVRIVIENLSIK